MSANDPGGHAAAQDGVPALAQDTQPGIAQQHPQPAADDGGDRHPFFLDEKATATAEIPYENILEKDGWCFRRVLIRTAHPFPGASSHFSKLIRDKFPKATVGFAESSGSHVCLFIKSASVCDVDAFIGGILPLQAPHHRIRLALTSDVMFHVGCLRQALAMFGEVRHLAIESGNPSGRPLFGRKATAVVRIPAGTKIPGTLSFSMSGLTYAVKVTVHPVQSPPAPRVAGPSAPRARSAVSSTSAGTPVLDRPHAPARQPAGIANSKSPHPPAGPGKNAPLRENKYAALGDGFAPAGTCFAFFNQGKCKRNKCRFEHVRSKALANPGADAAVEAAGMSTQAGQAATESKVQPACEAHGTSEKASEKTRANREAPSAEETSQAPRAVDTHLDPACARASGLEPPAATDVGSAPPTAPKAVSHADGSDGDDTALNKRLRSDDSGDDQACLHDTLEVLAVEGEQHLCVRCKKEWTPVSPSVMSCTACNGLVCDHCHRRLGLNASRRATKNAQRLARASRGGREDSPCSFRQTSSSS